MAHDVFVSHSSKDKPVADAMVAALEARGVRCWVAPRDILPGQEWGESIVNAIAASKVLVLVFSNEANASRQVRREVERAVHRDVAIVPFRIERAEPTKSLEYFISTPHWLDAIDGPMDGHLSRLADTILALLNPTTAARSEDRPRALASITTGQPQTSGPSTSRRAIVAGVVLTSVALLVAGAVALRGRTHPDGQVNKPTTRPAGVATTNASPLTDVADFPAYDGPTGRPMSETALVARPAAVTGLASWTIETRSARGAVLSLAYSPNGRQIATSGVDGAIRIWDVEEKRLLHVLSGVHTSLGEQLAWSPDGHSLIFIAAARQQKWDMRPKPRLVFDRQGLGAAWSQDGTRIASIVDGAANLLDATTGSPILIGPAMREPHALCFGIDDLHLFVGDADGLVGWDTATNKLTKLGGNGVASLALSPKRDRLVVIRDTRLVEVWDVATTKQISSISIGGADAASWSADGGAFLTASWDGICVFSQEGRLMRTLPAAIGGGPVSCSPNGDEMVYVSLYHNDVHLASTRDGSILGTLPHPLHCARWSRWTLQGGFVGTQFVDTDEQFVVLLAPSGAARRVQTQGVSTYGEFALSPDGSAIAFGKDDGVTIRSTLRPEQVRFVNASATTLDWSPDGRLLVGANNTVWIWDAGSGKQTTIASTRDWRKIAWSRNGKLLAVGDNGGLTTIFELSGKIFRNLRGSTNILFLAWSQDDSLLVTPDQIWDVKTGEVVRRITGPVGVSSDGQLLATAAEPYGSLPETLITDLATGEVVQTLHEGSDLRNRIGWLPDGTLAGVDTSQGIVRYWNKNGELRGVVLPIFGPAETLRIGREGRYVASPSLEDELVYVTRTPDGEEQTLKPAEFAARYGWKN